MHIKKHLSFSALRNVLSDQFNQIADARQSGKVRFELHDCLMSGFAMMLFQDPSLCDFQRRLCEVYQKSNLHSIFAVSDIPKDSQMRDLLDEVTPGDLEPAFATLLNLLQRGKHLEPYRVLGNRYLVPIDGSEYFSSQHIHCPGCLTQKKNSRVRYHHNIVQAVIVHPDMKQVLPLAPEEITNRDGTEKQDCEINAAKRLLVKLRKAHPKLPFIIDRWVNQVPINGSEKADDVNFFDYQMIVGGKVTYRNSWVTDISVNADNIVELIKAGRCRWKIENETFNTLKNQGYHIEHNFGHGKKHLSMVFFLLNLLAFYVHQILDLTDRFYQRLRYEKFTSRKEFWNQLRCTFRILLFRNWEHMFEYLLDPPPLQPP